MCVGGGRGSSGDKEEGKERKRENREETERGGKGRSQWWKYELRTYEPLYQLHMVKYTVGLTLQEVCSKTIKLCLCMLSQCNCGIHSPITLALCVQHKLTKCASNIGSIPGSSMHSLRSHLSTVHSPEPAWTNINQ